MLFWKKNQQQKKKTEQFEISTESYRRHGTTYTHEYASWLNIMRQQLSPRRNFGRM